jgi:hypothetical protein
MIMGGRAKAHHSASEMATHVLINLEVRTIIDVNNIFRFHNMRTCLAVLFVLVLTTLGAAKPFDKELAAKGLLPSRLSRSVANASVFLAFSCSCKWYARCGWIHLLRHGAQVHVASAFLTDEANIVSERVIRSKGGSR